MGLPPELAFVFGETENVFHRTRLISREMVAENTLALTIQRPDHFEFEAGQNTVVSIPGAHAEHLKEFTIASAPYEDHIVLAMRVRNSSFKNACYALKSGDAIRLRDAAGSLWAKTDAPQLWFSGGIGITPFRSVIRELIHQDVSLSVTHFHSDRTSSSVPFMQEFESYAAADNGYRFIPTTTREGSRDSLSGRITGDMISEHAPGYAQSACFVVGTESFVASIRDVLGVLGVPATRVRTERFEGYRSGNS